MYDQSFCRKTLEHVLWKRDFCMLPTSEHKTFREAALVGAISAVETSFNSPNSPLQCFSLRGKHVYRIKELHDELVVRKLVRNLKRCVLQTGEGRAQITTNLRLLLEEGVPYRVYRLDVRSFYESFQKYKIQEKLYKLPYLSPQSKSLINTLLDSHTAMGGLGIPRGLSLSAVFSDLLMEEFDHLVRSGKDVFYYSRYVDDIIILTSARERPEEFINHVKKLLPQGLHLNPDKKMVKGALSKVSKSNKDHTSPILSFDYLGYAFSVSDPTSAERKKDTASLNRAVSVDIARRKLKKFKTRIVRSFLDFSRSRDWNLLCNRIAFLTQNFSVYNQKAEGKKLAGIYHSYPLVNPDSDGLREIDRFLRNAVLANTGRVFSKSAPLLNGNQKRRLLKYSFVRGHKNKSFVHFSSQRISEIQRCWIN